MPFGFLSSTFPDKMQSMEKKCINKKVNAGKCEYVIYKFTGTVTFLQTTKGTVL